MRKLLSLLLCLVLLGSVASALAEADYTGRKLDVLFMVGGQGQSLRDRGAHRSGAPGCAWKQTTTRTRDG